MHACLSRVKFNVFQKKKIPSNTSFPFIDTIFLCKRLKQLFYQVNIEFSRFKMLRKIPKIKNINSFEFYNEKYREIVFQRTTKYKISSIIFANTRVKHK